jgi:hypothetical protein
LALTGYRAQRSPPQICPEECPVADQPTPPESAPVEEPTVPVQAEEPTVPVQAESTAADRDDKTVALDAARSGSAESPGEETPAEPADSTSLVDTPPSRRSRAFTITVVAGLVAVLVAAVVAIVVVIGGSGKGSTKNSRSTGNENSLRAKQGECLAGASEKELKRVDCSNPDVVWTVVGVTDNKTEADAKKEACAQWPEAEASYWESRNGKTGFVLCLASVPGK